VTVDNWFTSVPLAMKLLKDHNLTFLETIRKNKKEIPPQLVQTKNKAVNTSMFCFRKKNDNGFLCAKQREGSIVGFNNAQ
jgi:hypothetical protein